MGKRNINLYLGMKLAEANSKNPEIRNEKISELKALKEKMDEIITNNNPEIIKALHLKGSQIKGLGLNGQQVGEALNLLVTYIKSDRDIYAYYDSNDHLQKYKKQINTQLSTYAKEIKDRDKKVKGNIIDKIRVMRTRIAQKPLEQNCDMSAEESSREKKPTEQLDPKPIVIPRISKYNFPE